MNTVDHHNFSTLFLDLDGTFYGNDLGLWETIGDRIDTYLEERMGFDKEKIARARYDYYTQYGTTLRGLMLHHNVTPLDYLAFVHDVPYSKYLTPDLELQKVLEDLPGDKWIFTNADAPHTQSVLEALGVSLDLFQGIIDVVHMNYLSKPDEAAYRQALAIAGEPDPAECVMVDDQDRNLTPARQLGMHTVLVGPDVAGRAAHANITALHQLPAALNGLIK